VLSVLLTILKVAEEWGEIDKAACKIKLAKVQNKVVKFYEFDQYERLVEAARKHDPRAELVVLLGGSAGLRMGEIRALRFCDVDFVRNHLVIVQAQWRKTVDTTKGDKARIIPMTPALAASLKAHRHLKGDRVLYNDDGEEVSHSTVRSWLIASEKRAGLPQEGCLHKLRHTFGSHLAMLGRRRRRSKSCSGTATW
jgi:integrase